MAVGGSRSCHTSVCWDPGTLSCPSHRKALCRFHTSNQRCAWKQSMHSSKADPIAFWGNLSPAP